MNKNAQELDFFDSGEKNNEEPLYVFFKLRRAKGKNPE